MDILTRIQKLLEMQGKSQTDLTNALGLKQPAFSEWKSGKSASYKKYLYQIADYFGVTVSYLRGETSSPEVEVIPADPEKAREHQKALDKQRDEIQRQHYEALKNYYEPETKKDPPPEGEGDIGERIVVTLGRDGKRRVYRYSQENYDALQVMLEKLCENANPPDYL